MIATEVRQVTPTDGDALRRFSCRSWAHPWTADVEASIHCLADELERSASLVAWGLWSDDELRAIVVWRILEQARLCQGLILAVANGHRRQGHARTLKQLELDEARRAGCRAVISKVHWDNRPMLRLNEALGANVERIDGDRDHAHCIVPL